MWLVKRGSRLIGLDLRPEPEGPAGLEAARRGYGFWRLAERVMGFIAVLLLLVMLADDAVGRYQQIRLRLAREKRSVLETMALSGLRGDVQTIRHIGDGRYELTLTFGTWPEENQFM